MMNPRYLQRFGESPPFGDPIARAALRYDPEAPYGEPALGENEGQRLFEQTDPQPSMNKNSLVASDDPYANYGSENGNDAGARQIMQPQAESSTKLNPLEPVNDPYLDYDSEVPIRATRRLFQPPPLPSMKRGSMVSIEDKPPMAPSAPLVIDTRELPTEAPPENPVRRYQRELDALKAPDRTKYPVSKWAKLAAVALGAGQGYYNAANPNARPIDASEAVQNLTLGRKYIDAMGDYQRTRKDISDRLKLAGDAENVESSIANREAMNAERKSRNAEFARQVTLTDEDRDKAAVDRRAQAVGNFEKQGIRLIPANAPLPPGAEEYGPNLFGDQTQRMVREKNFGLMKSTKAMIDAGYPEYVDKTVFSSAQTNLNRPNPEFTTDYKDFLLSKNEGYTGTYPEWRQREANLRKPQTNNFQTPNYASSADGASNPVVEMYAKYQKAFPPQPTRNPQAMANWNELVKQVKLTNPKFNPETGLRAVRDFSGSGKANQNLLAINTAANHISDLEDAIKAKGSGDFKMLNRVIQSYQRNTGDTTQSDIDTIIPLLTQEISKAYMTAGGTVGERNSIAESLNAAKGYDATHTALARTVKLFNGRVNALKSQYERDAAGNKWEDQTFISREAQSAFDRFVPKSSNQNAGPGRGGGSGGSIPTAKTREQYVALPPGSEYIGPDGETARKP